jgi:hypothetical protein
MYERLARLGVLAAELSLASRGPTPGHAHNERHSSRLMVTQDSGTYQVLPLYQLDFAGFNRGLPDNIPDAMMAEQTLASSYSLFLC